MDYKAIWLVSSVVWFLSLNRIFGVVGQGSAEGGAFLVDPLAAANS